jgi:hypothetical protein
LIRDNEKLACELLNRIHAAQDSLKAAMDVLDGAEARMICAGSILELEEQSQG